MEAVRTPFGASMALQYLFCLPFVDIFLEMSHCIGLETMLILLFPLVTMIIACRSLVAFAIIRHSAKRAGKVENTAFLSGRRDKIRPRTKPPLGSCLPLQGLMKRRLTVPDRGGTARRSTPSSSFRFYQYAWKWRRLKAMLSGEE